MFHLRTTVGLFAASFQIADYWVVRKGHVRVADFYTTKRDGWYYYTFGVNFRAYAAYICGIMINVVGFAGAGES